MARYVNRATELRDGICKRSLEAAENVDKPFLAEAVLRLDVAPDLLDEAFVDELVKYVVEVLEAFRLWVLHPQPNAISACSRGDE